MAAATFPAAAAAIHLKKCHWITMRGTRAIIQSTLWQSCFSTLKNIQIDRRHLMMTGLLCCGGGVEWPPDMAFCLQARKNQTVDPITQKKKPLGTRQYNGGM